MLTLSDLLSPERVILDLRVRDKTQLLHDVGVRAARDVRQAVGTVVNALAGRERLGSTGLGRGFALPHARLAGMSETYSLFIRLARPIEYDAIDGLPVDLVILLLMPAGEQSNHMAALATIARTMRNPLMLRQTRYASSEAELLNSVTQPAL